MTTGPDMSHIPAGGPAPASLSPPAVLEGEERSEAVRVASAATDAMRINVRVQHPDGRVAFWSAREVLEGGGEPLGLNPATERLLREGARQLLAVLEKARPQHQLRFFLTTPGDDEPRHNGLVVTCRHSGAVTDLGIDALLEGSALTCNECPAGIAADLARSLVQAARRLHAAVKAIAGPRLELAIRSFDEPTADGW